MWGGAVFAGFCGDAAGVRAVVWLECFSGFCCFLVRAVRLGRHFVEFLTHFQKCGVKYSSVALLVCGGVVNWGGVMNTDRKIGFAMGILLVGIVAALFFRNEPLDSGGAGTGGLVGEFEQLLNQRLRDRQVAVYANRSGSGGAEGEPQWTMRDVLKDMHDRNRTLPAPVLPPEQTLDGGVLRNNLDGFRTRRPGSAREPAAAPAAAPAAGAAGAAGLRSVAAARVAETAAAGVSAAAAVDEPVFDSDIDGADGVPAAVEAESVSAEFRPPEEFDEYTVKYGDTLSGIAERTLGAQGRYSLIYDANRDRMSNPNQLVPGKVLRIPRTAAASGGG